MPNIVTKSYVRKLAAVEGLKKGTVAAPQIVIL